ncbi:MobQ family relaxase [Rubellimicrobium aerolatum]|uniref:MobQ family relaxase n=1 Tax=Rubellimicrobium aerolatum TaxID=490979 RepID=A0ABW0SDP0_9RHOB
MAIYHLVVKVVQRSAGRSATAAAAFRAACVIHCEREGKTHNYTRKQGVVEGFILAPEGAPAWAQDRAALWNAAEARERRRDGVPAREWELGLPAELSLADRRELTRAFAQALVARYGVAADVTIHAPNRDGDQRNWHAHVLTTTRRLGTEGLTSKTRELDAPGTRSGELRILRELWADLQNAALARAGRPERVDHRRLAVQREAALARGDAAKAEELDRPPEVKLGVLASGAERQARRRAEREGRPYVSVTDRGELTQAVRQVREAWAELRKHKKRAREAGPETGQGG